jgi:hypothetical protein
MNKVMTDGNDPELVSISHQVEWNVLENHGME